MWRRGKTATRTEGPAKEPGPDADRLPAANEKGLPAIDEEGRAGSPRPLPPAPNAYLLPLYRTWHVWFRGPHRLGIHRPERLPHDRQRSEITDIGNFGSIGDFWEWFNNLPGPSALWADCDLCFFQQGVGPAWEDPANANGGRWVVSAEQLADQRWESLCLDLVGETLDPGGEVTGVILGCRRPKRGPGYVRAAVWMRERTHDAAVLAVGHGCKGALGVAKLEFQDHPAEYNQVYRHAI